MKHWKNLRQWQWIGAVMLAAGIWTLLAWGPALKASAQSSTLHINLSFSKSVHPEPVTGRMFLIVGTGPRPEPRWRAGSFFGSVPFFGRDVEHLEPGQSVTFDSSVEGFPLASLKDLPAGDYYIQGLLNVYTQFHRADGHTIWAHMDQWEGQNFKSSPGNLYSTVMKVHLDPSKEQAIKLVLDKVNGPINVPADTAQVKRIKIQSKLLSTFWGHPIYIGATVLLPRGYDEHPDAYYPTVYKQGHFGLGAPFGFSTNDFRLSEATREHINDLNQQSGWDFQRAWNSDGFPRVITVTFQHPTPYFDDSYAVNSANNGPYGDALLTELIPYLEEHFRMIPKPYARILTGGSTGGWESLALQIYHPDFFGGTWTLYPDPIDFTRYQMTDIYGDTNAFEAKGLPWLPVEHYMTRNVDGQPLMTTRQMSQLEDVLGSHGRSCQQFEAWEAVYGPVGEDGYPVPLWDKKTGKIDHQVAEYMRDHGYDLKAYLEKNWSTLGPKLKGKLRIYVGDMDNYYLNLAVYRFQHFLEGTHDPHYAGTFGYGRPMKGHGWHPKRPSEMIRDMARVIVQNAPAGAKTGSWMY